MLGTILGILQGAGILSQLGGMFGASEAQKKQEEEEKKRRAIELANYMSDRFGQGGYSGGRSWF